MVHVMRMSTDHDIQNTHLDPRWGPVEGDHQWAQVSHGGLNIPNNATIVVVAHGDNDEIGNERQGQVDITAEAFLAIIHSNMHANAHPAAIYISACAHDIAAFAARVNLTASANQIWHNTSIHGHYDPVAGPVPPPGDPRWSTIYPRRGRSAN